MKRHWGSGPSRQDLERELDREIEYHLSRVTKDLVAKGYDEQTARRMALERFGHMDSYRAAIGRIDRRRVREMRWRDGAARFANTIWMVFRRLRRSPGLTVNVVAILGLGIGANAVMFGVVDRLLLSPPQHVDDPDGARLLFVSRSVSTGDQSVSGWLTYPDYLDFREVGAFSDVGAYARFGPVVLGRGEAAEEVRANLASASLFATLGVEPHLGRFFFPSEDRFGAAPVVVLAEEFWRRRFGGDRDILGRTLDIGDALYEVVGIAPAGFTGPQLSPVDVWLPIETAEGIRSGGSGWRTQRGNWWLHAVARLAPGATDESASAEATARHRSARAELIAEDRYSPDASIRTVSLIAGRSPAAGDETRVAQWLAGVSLIVLLIACFNVANLLLARATRVRRETAVRLAMGAPRSRLVAELMTESMILAGLGGAAALMIAGTLGGRVHQTLLPGVAFTDTALAGRLAAFTVAAAVVAGLFSGLLPALQSTRGDVAGSLSSGGRGLSSTGSPTRTALLVAQGALSVVLLVGAGLFVQSLSNAQDLDLGFDADRVAVVRLTWNETLPGAERALVYRNLLSRLQALPSVQEVGLTYTIPFYSSISIGRPRVPGLDSIPRHRSGGPYVNKVGAGYFEAMGLDIRRGRPFDARDEADGSAPVTIVTEGMARAIWPDVDPIGQCLIVGSPQDGQEPPCSEVVGVVEDHRRDELLESDPHFMYFVNEGHPAFQGPPQALMVRLPGSVDSHRALLVAESGAVSPLIRFVNVLPMADLIAPQLRSWSLGASMFSAFGLLALVVAAWGLYGVLAFDVALRRMEIGVRTALGAGAGRIAKLVATRALILSAGGMALGFGLALVGSRFIQPLLFQVSATDGTTYLTVALVLLAAASGAGLIPAWRAASVEPTEALRME